MKTFDRITEERKRQDEKWGAQNHSDLKWFAILGEEIGEVSKSILEENCVSEVELIQSAAVIVAWIECLEKRRKRWGGINPLR